MFYHFKHYAAEKYRPTTVCLASPGDHCGVCYHSIDYKYCFVSETGEPFEVLWRSPEGEDVVLQYPSYICSGSECIHLSDELVAITRKYMKDLSTSEIEFYDGRICADDLICNAKNWVTDYAVFPLEWVYFNESLRDRLVWYQYKRKTGAHVECEFEGSLLSRMKKAYATYTENAELERAWMATQHHEKLIGAPICRAEVLFYGKDKFGRIATRKSHGEQACEPEKYVILTREQAIQLYR